MDEKNVGKNMTLTAEEYTKETARIMEILGKFLSKETYEFTYETSNIWRQINTNPDEIKTKKRA